ncbi:MAG: aromatic amino acid ammonia-lyase [Propionibacteriaceae bacterium]|nr:aromatic amino acid ammonia-lyase [Propionibacteriaceae bacterium]
MRDPEAVVGLEKTVLSLALNGASLTWRDLAGALSAEHLDITLDPVARQLMGHARAAGLAALEADPQLRVYGWNQALGPFKDRRLEPEEQLRFQVNVLRSHSTGLGEVLPWRVARLALIVRANCLARGTSGARPELVDRMTEAVNLGLVPVIPGTGSMGMGDLQPMAAAGLALTGDAAGRVMRDDGQERSAPQAWAAVGREPEFQLATGEAIALISGSAVLTAHLAYAVEEVYRQVETFLGAFALFCEAARVEKSAFDPRIHAERHMPWETQANELILRLMGDSQWATGEGRLRAGELAPRIQDATSVRSVPHQVGLILRELERAREDVTREANSSTCNPLLTPDPTGEGYQFLSGGNWDATVLGQAAQSVNGCLARLAVLTKDLGARLLHDGWSHGLRAGLSGGEVGLNSGMLLLHTSAAALIPEIQLMANPVGALSFPLKGGQEDFHTMAMAAVGGLVSNSRRFDQLLAVLFIISGQGIHLLEEPMRGLALGAGSARVYGRLRDQVVPLGADRVLSPEVDGLVDSIRQGDFAALTHELLED